MCKCKEGGFKGGYNYVVQSKTRYMYMSVERINNFNSNCMSIQAMHVL